MLNIKNPILSFLILSGFYTFGQEVNCSDFSEGTFLINIEEPIAIEWKIIREGNKQIESIEKMPETLVDTGYPEIQYANIEWIDECSYKLTYDDSKIELTQTQKLINQNNGVLVKVIKVEESCFFYKSIMVIDDKEMVIDGKMCKE